ncbi:hypothetical protein ACQ5SK_29525 [Bradyrhizobium japonicum]
MVAGYFRSLGYRVGLLLDTDREPDDKTILAELKTAGVSIFRWKEQACHRGSFIQGFANASSKEAAEINDQL